MNGTISVIIPFYNGAKYLSECVNSVLNQTYTNLEVILIDDGSTDASSLQAEEFRRQDARVRVLHKQNGGPGDSRNAGLAMATGEFVSFVDHDDRLESTSLAQLMALQERTQADIAIANFYTYVEERAVFRVTYHKSDYFERVYSPAEWFKMEYEPNFSINECFSVVWGKIYRRELWDDVAFPIRQTAEDDFTTWRVYLGAEKIAFMNTGLYMYRQRPDSLTAQQHSLQTFTLAAVEQRLATLALLGFDITPEVEAYRNRLEAHRAKLLNSGNADPVLYKNVCQALKLLAKYRPDLK